MNIERSTIPLAFAGILLWGSLAPAAFGAMCGTSPATTSPGYYCSNYCRLDCPQRSCSAFCCDWIFDPGGGETWGSTTCGASPYPCDDCGNGFCGGCESYTGFGNTTACRRDCTNGSGPDRDACVPHVQTKFNWISTSDKTFKINNHGGSSTGQPAWDDMENSTWSECHFQGIARLRDYPWIAMVANQAGSSGIPCTLFPQTPFNRWGVQLFFARMDSKSSAGDGRWGSGWSTSQDQVEHYLSPPDDLGAPPALWHPGGMQAIGDYLLLAIDSTGTTLYTVDVANLDADEPEVVNETVLDGLDNQQGTGTSGDVSAHAVAAVQDADGHYLVATNFNNGNAWMFRSQSEDLADPDYRYLGPIEWSPASEIRGWDGSGMVRECGTDTLYLVTFYNTNPSGIFGENKAQLWRLDVDEDEVQATHLETRNFHDASGAFYAGVGLYVQGSTGRMAIYSSERNPDGAATGGNRDLDCDEWW